MRPIPAAILTLTAILFGAGIVFLAISPSAKMQSASAELAPGEVRLTGVIRDFHADHPDFDRVPGEGLGHYAGDVGHTLDNGRRPVFVPGGFKVAGEWRDADGRPIAPHLFGVGGNPAGADGSADGSGGLDLGEGIRIDGTILFKKGAFDSFDSRLGPYGVDGNEGGDVVVSTNATTAGAVDLRSDALIHGDVLVGPGGDPTAVIVGDGVITGTTGVLEAPVPMPPVVVPTDAHVGPTLGDVWFKNDEQVTISENMHTDDFRISTRAEVTVDGNVTILVDGQFTTETQGVIIVTPGSSLDIYVHGKTVIKTRCTWSDPAHTRLWVVGAPELKIETAAAFHGSIIAPEATLLLKTDADVYGSFVGRALQCETGGQIHVDRAAATVGASTRGPVLAVNGKFSADGSLIDGYDSTAGPYGGDNAGLHILTSSNGTDSDIMSIKDTTVSGDVLCGPDGHVATAVKLNGATILGLVGTLDDEIVIDDLSPPAAMPPHVGDVSYVTGTHTLDVDLHCAKLAVDGGAVLWIEGDVRIYATEEFKVSASEVRLRPGATLTIWVQKDFKLENGARFNANTADPSLVTEYHLQPGSDNVKVDGGSLFFGHVVGAPGASLTVAGSEFFGAYRGGEIKIQDGGAVHIDLAGAPATCVPVADLAGSAGAIGSGGITSVESYGQWFRDVLGTNQSMAYSITLTPDDDGVLEYLDDAFHPIDGRLYGDGGQSHNHYFTYAIAAEFTYAGCGGGQFIEFEGGDGAWIFIDGRLVTDLGGVQPMTEQYLELDRLGLVEGNTYDAHLFYAQRHHSGSVFRLRTNIDLSTDGFTPTVTSQYD